MTKIDDFDLEVLLKLLCGDVDALKVLRSQLESAEVSSKEYTGVGFYTKFKISPNAPRIKGNPSFELTDVNGIASNVKHGIGFVLFVRDGMLSMLEGFTFDEPWPDKIDNLQLEYSAGEKRDMESIKNILK